MDKKQMAKVLSEIQTRANNKYPVLFIKKEYAPEVVFVMKKAIESENLPQWKRDYYKALLPDFEKTEEVLDEEVAKKKENFIQNEINLAISKGKLPKRKDIPKLK